MAGELLRWQMGQIEQRIKDEKLPVKYLLQVHDELVYHVDKSFADEFKQLMYSIMTTLPEEYPYIPLDVSVDYDERYTK
jgi:DNA polymerase I-like protein with 3'-5' exonuclease and polymerase domains